MPDASFAPVDIECARRADGSILMRNRLGPAPMFATIVDALEHWARTAPDRCFLAERQDGDWRRLRYGDCLAHCRDLAALLLAVGCGPERPLMILAPNGIAHAEFALAAMIAGVPAAPVSPSHVGRDGDMNRLRLIAGKLEPGALFLDLPDPGPILEALGDFGLSVVTPKMSDAMPRASDEKLAKARAAVGSDTVAKLLFTSGSTGTPKAVINTHDMIMSNQAALSAIWPCIDARPPVLVDWLPWSHTFGGNFTFTLALARGGTFYVDEGKPLPGLVERTVANLGSVAPTVYFNVPGGYEALLPFLEDDPAFARHFFSRLDFLFCAAAALPQKLRDRLDRLGGDVRGEPLPVLTAWGTTEMAPCSTAVYFQTPHAGNLGLPIPGTTIKLAPVEEKLEIRAGGPNVMPGYWRDPEASAAAFDEEGFYRTGDAALLFDAKDPTDGIAFDGRIAENFKLLSGTWVNVGTLRVEIVDAARPFVQDAVIAGHDRSDIGLLVFPNLAGCEQALERKISYEEASRDPDLTERLRSLLRAYNATQTGSSRRIGRFLVLDAPPDPEGFEITDKGYLNQRAVLRNRAEEVERLYCDEGHRVAVEMNEQR